MDPEETLPPRRRAADERLAVLESDLAENTKLTAENTVSIKALSGTVDEIKTGTESLLDMKKKFEAHLDVLCTWGKWGRRALWGLLSVAGAALPIMVAAKELGWWPF